MSRVDACSRMGQRLEDTHMPASVLVIEDDPQAARLVVKALRTAPGPLTVTTAERWPTGSGSSKQRLSTVSFSTTVCRTAKG